MTRTERTFPTPFRLLAAACALFAMAWIGTSPAGAQSQGDVDEAIVNYQDALDARLAKLGELAIVRERLTDAAFLVDQQEGELERVQVELADTRAALEAAQLRYDRIRVRLDDRAAEAYMDGPGADLEFILGASSLADLSDRIEFVGVVAESDASLAQRVDNLSNELAADELELEALEADEKEKLADLEAAEEAIANDLLVAQRLAQEAQALADRALELVVGARTEYREAQRELEQQATVYNGPQLPIPDGFEGVLESCPVAQPRAFGDGFGAPRYIGGFHLHKGVDIVAPEGTPVLAAFSGTAMDSTNSLGGIAVKVVGQYGTVYNAHLLSIEKLGPVSAGETIGYVGSTGLAGGTTPHNHFEFHPHQIPPDWPAGYYGYSVIDDAVNPYPLLVEACY